MEGEGRERYGIAYGEGRSQLRAWSAVSDRPCLPTIVIHSGDPARFLGYAAAAMTRPARVVFTNPHWQPSQWQQVAQQCDPDLVWGEPPPVTVWRSPAPLPPLPCVLIPTGGSSGTLRWVIHSPFSLTAAVRGFQAYAGLGAIHSFCVLPPYHISGFGQWWRSQLTGGDFYLGDYAALKRGCWPDLPPQHYGLSLVPSQLQTLLHGGGAPWLRSFRFILLGGAPAWPDLLETARAEALPLAPTYGMTETAGQVVTLLPEDFLAGRQDLGSPLPHGHVSLDETGAIRVGGLSLAWGYHPPAPWSRFLMTDDLGRWQDQGGLEIWGRRSDTIISGGVNVFPAAIAGAIQATGLVEDVAVLGWPDRQWGETVIACYIPRGDVSEAQLKESIRERLTPPERPQIWLPATHLPRNPQGKLEKPSLIAWVHKHLAPPESDKPRRIKVYASPSGRSPT